MIESKISIDTSITDSLLDFLKLYYKIEFKVTKYSKDDCNLCDEYGNDRVEDTISFISTPEQANHIHAVIVAYWDGYEKGLESCD